MGTEPVTNAGLAAIKDVNDGANAIHKTTEAAVDDLGFNKPSLIKWGKWFVGKLGPFGYVVTIVLSPVLIPVSLTYDAGRGIKLLLRKITKVQEPVQKLLPMTAKQVEDAKKLEQRHKDLESQHASEIKGLKDQAAHQAQQLNQKLSREQNRNHELNILLERVVRRGDDLETDNARRRASYQALKDTLDKQLAEKEFGIQQLSKELEAARQQHDHTKEENIWARQVQADRIRSLESKLSAEQKQKCELEARHQTEVSRLEGLHQFDLMDLEDQYRHNVEALELRHQDHMQALNDDKEVTIQGLLREVRGLRELTDKKDRDHNNELNILTNHISVQRDQIRRHEEKEQQLRREISQFQGLTTRKDQDNNNNAVNAPYAPMSDQTVHTMQYEMTDCNLTAELELHRLLVKHQGLPSDQPGVMNYQYLVEQADKVLQQKTLLLGEETELRTKAELDLKKLQAEQKSLKEQHIHSLAQFDEQCRQICIGIERQAEESSQRTLQQMVEFQNQLSVHKRQNEELQLRITDLEEDNQELENHKESMATLLEESKKLSHRLSADYQDQLKVNQRLLEDLDSLEERFRQLPALDEACLDSENDDPETAELEFNVHQQQASLKGQKRTALELLEVKKTEIAQLTQQYSEQYRHLEVQLEESNKRLQVVGMENFELRAAKKEVDELKERLAEMSSSAKKVSRNVQTSEVSVTGPRELVDMASQADVESREVTDLKEELASTQAQLKEVIRSSSEHHSIVSPTSPEKVSLTLQATPEDVLVEPRELVHMASHAGVEPNEEVNALKQELQATQAQLIQFIHSAREFQPVFPETIELSSYGSSSREEGSFEGGMSMLAPGVDHSLVGGSYHQELGHRTFNDPGEIRFKDLCIEKEALKKRLEGMEQQMIQVITDNDNLTDEKDGLLEKIHQMQSDLQDFDSLKRGFTEASEQRDEAFINYEAQKVVIENQNLRIKELQTEVTRLEDTSELELTDFKTKLTDLDEKNKEFAQKQQKLLADRSRLEDEKLELQSNLIKAMTGSNTSNTNRIF
ncbi:hypothetical protein [Endozoicomonas atrinae]|uniref:hypothetical protein n=1 Tax=Endozoicomonas atrinae TaxID=1333660 RepID=UPI0008262DA1|nr:hypothetical protein [Endozoicomonas atrinae]